MVSIKEFFELREAGYTVDQIKEYSTFIEAPAKDPAPEQKPEQKPKPDPKPEPKPDPVEAARKSKPPTQKSRPLPVSVPPLPAPAPPRKKRKRLSPSLGR